MRLTGPSNGNAFTQLTGTQGVGDARQLVGSARQLESTRAHAQWPGWPQCAPSSCASTATTCASEHCSISVSKSTILLLLNSPYMYACAAVVGRCKAIQCCIRARHGALLGIWARGPHVAVSAPCRPIHHIELLKRKLQRRGQLLDSLPVHGACGAPSTTALPRFSGHHSRQSNNRWDA